MPELSEYEQLRLEHIRRNQEMLLRLGLLNENDSSTANSPIASDTKGKKRKKRGGVGLSALPISGLRRSSRIKNENPEFRGVEDVEPPVKKSKKDTEEEEVLRQEVLEATTAVSVLQQNTTHLARAKCIF